MAHSLGESGNYHRPTETNLLEDYLKAVDLLTVNDEYRLSKKINELQEKNDEKDYVIKGKLHEKDEQIKTLKETFDTELKILKETILDMQELIKYPKKLSEL